VVLFDEVEKAALKVFDVLLQILDEGRLTSGKGETVSFSECVILMTSNIGSRYLADPELGEAAREAAEAELKAHFRPEFLNRLDDIIFFHPLTDEHLRQILDLMLKRENQLLANRNLNLSVSEAAKSWILSKNEHPEWGARPLRRLIAQYIRTPLTNFLLQEEPQDGATLKVEVAEGQLKIEF
jgi:ATP-dependent Clp protease ATP-binding subunit ClpB